MPTKKSNQRLKASRPVDPRNAPGAQRRKGPDPFAVGLIGVSTIVALLILIIFTNQNNSANTATIPVAGPAGGAANTNPSAAQAPTSTDPNAQATAAEVAFGTQTGALERISQQDAISLYQSHNAQIFDVRDKGRFDTGHITGAINIPNKEAGIRIAEFPKTGNVILYCQ